VAAKVVVVSRIIKIEEKVDIIISVLTRPIVIRDA
jgi:hypothetical protein